MGTKRSREERADTAQKPVKRARNYTDEDVKLAGTYDKLSSEDTDERLNAASAIVNVYVQKSYPKQVLERLIRGLCSSRKASRLGFWIALVEVLKHHHLKQSSLQDLLDVVLTWTEPDSYASKSEKREHKLGRLTAYNAILHSGLLFVHDASDGPVSEFVQRTLDLARSTPHLHEQCGRLWSDFVAQGAVHGSKSGIELLLNMLRDDDRLHTPEGLAVWLKAQLLDSLVLRLPQGVWQNDDPLDSGESLRSSRLKTALRSDRGEGYSTDGSIGNKDISCGIARHNPHFVWAAIIDVLLQRMEDGRSSKRSEDWVDADQGFIEKFWQNQVDGTFFSESASPEKKAMGFKICSLAIQKLPANSTEAILSSNMLNCLINQIDGDERLLHDAAMTFKEDIKRKVAKEEVSSESKDKRISPLGKILKTVAMPEDSRFEVKRLIKVQPIVMDILRSASEDALQRMCPIYRTFLSVLTQDSGSQSAGASLEGMKLIGDQMALGAASYNEFYPSGTLRLIFKFSCSTLEDVKAGEDKLADMRQIMRSRLWSCLRQVFKTTAESDPHNSRWHRVAFEQLDSSDYMITDGEDSQDKEVIFSRIDALKNVSIDIERTIQEARDSAAQIRMDLVGLEPRGLQGTDERIRFLRVLEIMFTTFLLQAFCGDEDAIQELADSVGTYQYSQRYRDEANKALLYDRVIDAVLVLIMKPESFFRLVAGQIYDLICPVYDLSAQEILGVLGKDESLAGQRELFDQQPEETEVAESDSEVDSDEVDSDVEEIEAHHEISDGTSQEDAASSSGSAETEGSENNDDDKSSSTEEEEDTNSADEALNASLGRILGTEQNPAHAADDASDTDTDATMSDSEMFAADIDSKLTSIFSYRKSRKPSRTKNQNTAARMSEHRKSQKEAKRTVVTFKSRVLALLSTFVTHHYSTPTCLEIITPLCRLIGRTRDAAIAKKAEGVLERYITLSRKRKGGLPVGVEWVVWEGLLGGLFGEVMNAGGGRHVGACGRGLLFLGRVGVGEARIQEQAEGGKQGGEKTGGPDVKKEEKKKQRKKHRESKKGEGKSEGDAVLTVQNVIQRLDEGYRTTRKAAKDKKIELPESFFENYKTWKTSMGFK